MMIRKTTFSIEHMEKVLKPVVLENLIKSKRNFGKPVEITLDGETIYALSGRYKLFFTKGYTCVKCGLTASFFALERSKGSKIERYHLNLYGYNQNGKEVLFTKDHILPKSRGGKDTLENYQTMCEHCNCKKGNKTEEELVAGKQAFEITPRKIQYDSALFVHPVQDPNQHTVIQHNGQYINIKMERGEVLYVEELPTAKKYKARSVEKILQKAISDGILIDTDMNNYKALSDRRLKREYKLSLAG